MTETVHEASPDARASAQDVKVVHHGDNDPDATAALRIDLAVVDRAEPRIVRNVSDRPMCWGPEREPET